MTINELARIAARYLTAMADAMIRACVSKAVETGERLELPERKPAKLRGKMFRPHPARRDERRVLAAHVRGQQ